MSLEEAIIANTAATRDLIAALARSGLVTHGTTTVTPAEAKDTAKPETAVKAETAAPITVEDCIKLVPGLVAKHGKEKVVALVAKFGVEKASKLKPEQAPAFHKEASALLAA